MENEQVIMNKLDIIKAEIDYIRQHMVEVDSILTIEEEERLEQSIKEFKEGKTISLEELEKKRKNVKDRVFK